MLEDNRPILILFTWLLGMQEQHAPIKGLLVVKCSGWKDGIILKAPMVSISNWNIVDIAVLLTVNFIKTISPILQNIGGKKEEIIGINQNIYMQAYLYHIYFHCIFNILDDLGKVDLISIFFIFFRNAGYKMSGFIYDNNNDNSWILSQFL